MNGLASTLAVPAGATLGAFLLTAALTEPARRVATRYGLTDRPVPHKAHRRATPYLGGPALVAGTVAPLLLLRHADPGVWMMAGAALGAGVLGLADDVRGLGVGTRLAVEGLLAAPLVAYGLRLDLPVASWLDALITVAVIVVLTNSFNLLDNTDGALATVVCAVSAPLAVCAVLGGRTGLGLLQSCLGAAAAGFLLHNAPPARIFLGDSGSLFAGFLIACAAVSVSGPLPGAMRPTFLLLAVFIAVLDTGLVVISRSCNGRRWWQGGTDHLAHRLSRTGVDGYGLLAVLLAGTTVCGLLAALVYGGLLHGPAVTVGALAGVAGLIGVLLRIPGYPAPAPAPAGPLALTAPALPHPTAGEAGTATPRTDAHAYTTARG